MIFNLHFIIGRVYYGNNNIMVRLILQHCVVTYSEALQYNI
jgi:hypothetical protein